MNRYFVLTILMCVGLAADLPAQQAGKPQPVHVRAVLHDPVRPVANLYYMDMKGELVQLAFRPHDFSRTMLMQPLNEFLLLYDKPVIDPEKPNDGVAARVKLAPNLRSAIIVVLPTEQKLNDSYRLVVIDDSDEAFPFGESKVLSLVGAVIGVQAGEQRVRVEPLKISRIPSVSKVNDFNMAQTNFHYRQKDGSWVTFTERQLQYVGATRRLFIVHATPGAMQPSVTTIVDTRI